MSLAVLFPGQGSQFVGMGAELFESRPDLLGERTDEILGWSLRSMCLDGPEEELTRTEHAQPALFALAYALWEEVDGRLPNRPIGAAGHSLGEYTALTAAGALAYDDALRIVALRGIAMQHAADLEPSGMAALLGATLETAEAVTAANRSVGGRLTIANLNAPGQVVVAGGSEDLDWLDANAKDHGVRRAVRLKVAGAFHSPFMQPASEMVAAALSTVSASEMAFPVYANVSASPVATDEMTDSLARQVVAPVRFSETLERMAADGATLFAHIGPGDVTAGMARRTVPEAEVVVIDSYHAIDDAIETISAIISP